MSANEIFGLVLGFLFGGLFGTVRQQIKFKQLLYTNDGLPWKAKSRLSWYFGCEKWSESCVEVEIADRSLYAMFLIAALHDLGGPLLLAPSSKEAFDGMLVEAERRYTEHCKNRRR